MAAGSMADHPPLVVEGNPRRRSGIDHGRHMDLVEVAAYISSLPIPSAVDAIADDVQLGLRTI